MRTLWQNLANFSFERKYWWEFPSKESGGSLMGNFSFFEITQIMRNLENCQIVHDASYSWLLSTMVSNNLNTSVHFVIVHAHAVHFFVRQTYCLRNNCSCIGDISDMANIYIQKGFLGHNPSLFGKTYLFSGLPKFIRIFQIFR